jgi:hypothetical protein
VVVRVDVGAGAGRASVYQRRDGGGAMRSDDVHAWRRTPLPPRPSLHAPFYPRHGTRPARHQLLHGQKYLSLCELLLAAGGWDESRWPLLSRIFHDPASICTCPRVANTRDAVISTAPSMSALFGPLGGTSAPGRAVANAVDALDAALRPWKRAGMHAWEKSLVRGLSDEVRASFHRACGDSFCCRM